MKTFANNIKKEVISVVDFFLSFLTTYDERRTQNMLALMLDIRFNGLRLISSFIGREHGVAIVGTIRKYLFPMLLKSYRYLHPLFEVESFFVHKLMKIVAWTFSKWWPTLVNLQRNYLIKIC